MTGRAVLLGALGLVGLGFALLFLVLALFGAPTDPYWVGGNLILGLVLLGAAAALGADSLRERVRSGEARRAGTYGTSAILTTLLGIAIICGLAFLGSRYHARFDWSEAKVHSLSDQTRSVLEGLEQDVHALALFPKLEAEPVRALLDRYAYVSERFQPEVVDPNERPDVLQRFGIEPSDLGGGLVRIGIGAESTQVTEPTEENLTNAIVKLTRRGDKLVYFLQGHNERAVEGEAAAAREGYGRAAAALRNENYEVKPLLLAAQVDVPEDADVVVVAGATRMLLEPEREALHRYLARGGALLALLDPRAKTDLVEDLRAWGVDVGEDVIIDRQLALFGREMSPIAQRYDASHEITRDLRDATLFHLARSVRSAGEGSGLSEIVFTSEHSWAERNLERLYTDGRAELDDDDLRGPVPVAVAGTPRIPDEVEAGSAEAGDGEAGDEAEEAGASESEDAPSPRLAVFGDADFAANELIETARNRDLFLNSVNWLLGDVEAISIRPARSRASRFTFTQADADRIRSLSLFVLPELIAVVGVFVWWSRRWSPGS